MFFFCISKIFCVCVCLMHCANFCVMLSKAIVNKYINFSLLGHFFCCELLQERLCQKSIVSLLLFVEKLMSMD